MAPFNVLSSHSDALLHSQFPCLKILLEFCFFQAVHDLLTRHFYDFLGLKMHSFEDFFHLGIQNEVIRCWIGRIGTVFQHNDGYFCQNLPSCDCQMCWRIVVVQQPAVFGPQLWLFSRNCSPQCLEPPDVVCSCDSLPAWYPVFQNYTAPVEERDDHGFCLWFGNTRFLRSRFFSFTPDSAIALQDRMQKSNFRLRLSRDQKHPNFLTTQCKCGREFPSVRCSNFLEPISRTLFACLILW